MDTKIICGVKHVRKACAMCGDMVWIKYSKSLSIRRFICGECDGPEPEPENDAVDRKRRSGESRRLKSLDEYLD